MRIYKLFIFNIFAISLATLFLDFPLALAANCDPSPGGDEIISSNCSFTGTVNGVDNGSLTINSGVTLTINNAQTIVWNSGKSITINGSIAFVGDGQLKKSNLWMIDADNDGYPDNEEQRESSTSPGTGYKRRNLLNALVPPDTTAPGTEISSTPGAVTQDDVSFSYICTGETEPCEFQQGINYGTGGSVIDDFPINNLAINNWPSTYAVSSSGQCGSRSGSYAMTFGGASSTTNERRAETPELNVSNGGDLEFYLKRGDGLTASSALCHQPNSNRDILLEYSLDGGSVWTIIARYDQSSYNTSFTRVFLAIPAGAKTNHTKFRFRQELNSAVNGNMWAIDDVSITGVGGVVWSGWGTSGSTTYNNVDEGGPWIFNVKSKDAAGNIDSTPETYSFTVDTTPPQTSITLNPGSLTNDNTPPFTASCTDAHTPCDYQYQVDSTSVGGWSSWLGSSFSLSTVADGPHTVYIRARDVALNIDPTPSSHTLTIDTVPPVTTASATVGGAPEIVFSENANGYGEGVIPNGWSIVEDNGGYNADVSVYASNQSGSETLGSRAIIVKGARNTGTSGNARVLAGKTLNLPSSSYTIDFNLNPRYQSYGGTHIFEVWADGSLIYEANPCGSSSTTCPNGNSYNISVIHNGAITQLKFGHRWNSLSSGTEDTAFDDIVITDENTGEVYTFGDWVNEENATVTLSANDGSTPKYCLSNTSGCSPLTTYAGPFTVTEEGTKYIRYQSTDAAGNTEVAQQKTVNLDRTAPVTSFANTPDPVTGDNTSTFTFGCTDISPCEYSYKYSANNIETPLQSTGISTPSTSSSNYNMGYRFSPNVDGQVTKLGARCSSGTRTVRLYRFSDGAVLASATVTTTGTGNWVYTSITPVSVTAGTDYIVAVRYSGYCYKSFSTNPDVVSGNVTIKDSRLIWNSDNMPDSFDENWMYGYADIELKVPSGGGTWSAWNSSATATLPQLADASYTLDARARDAAQNEDATPVSYSFTIDSSAPDTSIIGNPPAETNANSITFQYSCTETCEFSSRVDSQTWSSWSTSTSRIVDISSLVEGQHTFYVKARKTTTQAEDPSPASHTFEIDRTGPTASFVQVPPSTTTSDSHSITYSCNDAPCTYERKLNGGGWSTVSSSGFTWSDIPNGSNTVYIRATDTTGNLGNQISYTFTMSAPQTSLSGPSSTTDNTPTFTFSCATGNTPCQLRWKVDSNAYSAWSSSVTSATPSISGTGSHTFYAQSRDSNNLEDSTPAAKGFTIDPPTTSITGGPGFDTSDSTPTFTVTCSEVDTPCQYQWMVENYDTGQLVYNWSGWSNSTSITTSSLPSGDHRFKFFVRARDSLGNQGDSVYQIFKYDTTQPKTVSNVYGQPFVRHNGNSIAFRAACLDYEGYTGDERYQYDCDYSYRVDGGSWSAWVDGNNVLEYVHQFPAITNTQNGQHTFEFRVRDAAGLIDSTPLSHTFTIIPSNAKIIFFSGYFSGGQEYGKATGWSLSSGTSTYDNLCQSSASQAGVLPGNYYALVSSSSVNAKDRISNCLLYNTAGNLVSNSCNDLWDGNIGNLILSAEGYAAIGGNPFDPYPAWTGTKTDGTSDGSQLCTGSTGRTGMYRNNNQGVTNSQWINYGAPSCSDNYPVYCFQQ